MVERERKFFLGGVSVGGKGDDTEARNGGT